MVQKKKQVTYKQLEKEFDQAVVNLQRDCKHKQWSDWMDEWYAPGHGTDQKVRRCEMCNVKQYMPKTFKCPKCNKTQHRVLFQWYIENARLCNKCLSKHPDGERLKKIFHWHDKNKKRK